MKLPSVNYLLSSAGKSFLRFPLTLICAALGVVLGIYLVENHQNIQNFFPYINVLLCLALGIPLFFCVVIVCDKFDYSKKLRWIVTTVAAVLLVCIYLTLPGFESTHNTSLPYVKYCIYNIAIHLFVSYLPFITSGSLNGYWQYNKILFLRLWISALYSAVLYIGLALALLSLKELFDINLHDELFFEIFLVVAGILNTWFFVSGIPTQLAELDSLTDYPKGLKIFSQYILLPILALFLIILYVYGGKILILWHWPKGIVSYLIIGISVLGILTFLLLHPYHGASGNGWIRVASRGYYFALLPLLVILFLAIGMRVSDYGITISRYMIVLLGIWLTVLCMYTVFGKTNIRFIPASLAVMLLLMSFGPWGMFATGERAQVNRLEQILVQAQILKDGKIQNETIWEKDSLSDIYSTNELQNETKLNDSLHNEVHSILNYLDDHHGFASVRHWYKTNIDSLFTIKNINEPRYNQLTEADVYMRGMGLKPDHISTNYSDTYFSFQSPHNTLLEVKGYDYLIRFDQYSYQQDMVVSTFTIDSLHYELKYLYKPKNRLLLTCGKQITDLGLDSLTHGLTKKYGTTDNYHINQDDLRLSGSLKDIQFKAEFHLLTLSKRRDSLLINSYSGNLFITRK